MEKRIYVVRDRGDPIALIRAGSQAEAVRHCTRERFEASVAKQDELVNLLSRDAPFEIQTAGGE